MSPLRLLLIVLALVSLSCADSFDKPLSKKTVDLGPSPSSPETRAKVTCYFFAKFMVKQVDMGDKGAARLAIVPVTRGVAPGCTRMQGKTEKVISAKEWTGYFKGVKNDFVFFDADDGVNGGVAFAIYEAKTAKKIFEDSASGPLEFATSQGQQLSLRYLRVVDGECPVPKEGAACRERIRQKMGVENVALAMPDCDKGYEESAQNMAKSRCEAQNTGNPDCVAREVKLAREQWSDASSMVSYPVEVILDAQPVIKPIAGAMKCWPAD
jgi:hypothetical protein